MKELVGSDPFWVYSIKDGRVVPGLCTKAWKTGHRTDMLEVELDNGEKIRCTSNHPFMLRDGSYRMAMDLRPDDDLKPFQDEKASVSSIRQCAPEDVYDLQVEDHHNFATAAGVFVHNSTDSMQILRTKGIESKRVSTDISEEPWKNLRDLMYENRITMPLDPLLKNELLRLSRLPNGKVDHLPGSSKDLADSVACSAMGAVQMGGEEAPDGDRAYFAPVDFAVGKSLPMPHGMEYTPLDFHAALPAYSPILDW
jgi:hypothetical protein